jgi:hypothetical protein
MRREILSLLGINTEADAADAPQELDAVRSLEEEEEAAVA